MGQWPDGVFQWKFEPAMSETGADLGSRGMQKSVPNKTHKHH